MATTTTAIKKLLKSGAKEAHKNPIRKFRKNSIFIYKQKKSYARRVPPNIYLSPN